MTNDTTYNIRPATRDDFESVSRLLMPYYKLFVDEFFASGFILDDITPAEGKQVFIAHTSNQVVGFIHIHSENRSMTGSNEHNIAVPKSKEMQGHIESLYVRPDYRQQGIAKKLIDAAEEWAFQQDVSSIILRFDPDPSNTDSSWTASFYERNGYQPSFSTHFQEFTEYRKNQGNPPPPDQRRTSFRKPLSRDLG